MHNQQFGYMDYAASTNIDRVRQLVDEMANSTR